MTDALGSTRVLPSPARMGSRAALAAGAVLAGEAGVFVLLARWQRYLDVTGRCNADTRRDYRRAVCNFFADIYADEEWTGPRDPLALSEDDAIDWVRGWAPKRGPGRAGVLKAVKSYYQFAEDREAIERDPFRNIRIPRPKYDDPPFLTARELRRLLTAAELVDPRARWAIQLQYGTGARVGSIVALRWEDVKGDRIRIKNEKRDSTRGKPLEGLAAEAIDELRALADYCPKRGKRQPTVIGVGYERYRQWLKEAGERSGVDVFTHLLRHTRATDLSRAKTDVRTMMEIFDWKDPRMVDRYASPYDPHVRSAMALPIPE